MSLVCILDLADLIVIWRHRQKTRRQRNFTECRTFYLPVTATYRVPVSACCHLSNQLRLTNICFAWILWSNLPKAMRLKPLERHQWLIAIWQKIKASELKHDFQIIIKQCSVAFFSTVAKTNQGIRQVDYKYLPVSIHRKWGYQYSRKALNKLHVKEVCVRFQIHVVLITEIPHSIKVTSR